jgi:hypothetical protein
MKKAFLFPLLFFSLIIFGNDTKIKKLNENRVKERVTQYLNLFFGGHYEKAWKMLMPEVRGPFKWSKKRWVGQWKRHPPKEKLIAVNFREIKIVQKDNRYFALVYILLKSKFQNECGKEIDEEREAYNGWGFVNNDWYRFEQD